MKTDIVVREALWESEGPIMAMIRRRVFVDEQHVPESLEWDGLDPDCQHVMAFNRKGEAIGTGRLLPDGHIGRVAVLREWRGLGAGTAIMRQLIAVAQRAGQSSIRLNAQTPVLEFYESLGFVAFGEAFMEAGIPHRAMRLDVATTPVGGG